MYILLCLVLNFETNFGRKVNVTVFFVITGPKEACICMICAAYVCMKALKILVLARADYI